MAAAFPVFMNVFNCHVNRLHGDRPRCFRKDPSQGSILNAETRQGEHKRMNAVALVLRRPWGGMAVVQHRRTCGAPCPFCLGGANETTDCRRSAFGLIRFGSRLDVVPACLPPGLWSASVKPR